MYVCVCWLFGILGASATVPVFHYHNLGSIFRRSENDCKICYGDDCLPLDQARCEYYVETDRILGGEDEDSPELDPQLRVNVDNMVFEFMEMASRSSATQDCIPFVSYYTDCTKENICTGCKRCYCDCQGRWICTSVEQCRADAKVDVDHRLLVMVMENLSNPGKNSRRKRSTDHKNRTKEANTSKVNFEDITKWLYESKPIFRDDKPSLTTISIENKPESDIVNSNNVTSLTRIEVTATVPKCNTTESYFKSENKTDAGYLAFDELLNNIAGDNKYYSRRKPALDVVHNDSISFDDILIDEDDDKTVDSNVTNQFVYTHDVINRNGITKSDTEANKVVIDLLGLTERNETNDSIINGIEYVDTKINDVDPFFEDIQFNAVNIMKRDVSFHTNATEASTEKPYNVTMIVEELKNNALFPLSNIISDKEKELGELLRIRESLITFLKSYNNDNVKLDFTETKTGNSSNSYVSISKLDIVPEIEIEYNSRRNDRNLLEKYLYKLKRDIHEVMRDIVNMQKLSGSTKIPNDLKTLLRAIKHYVHKQNSLNNGININKNTHYRRQLDSNKKAAPSKTVNENLLSFLDFIDKNMPESNALAPLSPITKKIVTRIINRNYVDEFTAIGLRVSGTQYNLTNDLRNIGFQWQKLTKNVAQSSASDRLYAIKLLHLTLAVDIGKMKDALALIDYAHRRSMVPIEGHIGEDLMDGISKGLRAINDKIQIIIKLQNNNKHKMKTNMVNDDEYKKSKKESFLQKLRNILRNSKKDIAHLLKKKVPKAEIVKELARQKLDEISRRRFLEFEETMRKWQSNLDITPRQKRSQRYTPLKKRIKNIIPKYLRGKVNPAIIAKSSKNQNSHQEKVSEPYKKKTVTTTVKTKTISVRLNKMKRRH